MEHINSFSSSRLRIHVDSVIILFLIETLKTTTIALYWMRLLYRGPEIEMKYNLKVFTQTQSDTHRE